MKYIKINLRDVAFIQASNNNTVIQLIEKSHLISSSMADLINKLDCDYFVKIHRSYVINIYAVQSFTNTNVNIYTKNEIHELPISEFYKNDFFEKLKIIKTK
ncbi:MAG: LytTR family DNA-binding domain-containing protein [Saprospiraceae bacterium]